MKRIKRIITTSFLILAAYIPLFAQDAATETSETESAEENFDDEIALFFEGEELVVESNSEKQQAQSGVSVVLEKEEMETTSRLGLSEDIMSSVGTLPGVGFTGGWNAEPSIRGGYPREMRTTLDGVMLEYPWHWGGAYSIFNPNLVKSAKMNNGVFSSRYGRAVSGLLEVESEDPDELHFDFNLSYLSTELFIQAPITEKFGLIAYGKTTYLESLISAYRISGGDKTDSIKRAPYIRDFYTKMFYKPTDNLKITFNGFFGSDGLETKFDEKDEDNETLTMEGTFDYDIYSSILALNAEWNPTDKTQIKSSVSYNLTTEDLKGTSYDHGTLPFSDDFLALYGPYIPDSQKDSNSFALDEKSEMQEKITWHNFQGRASADVEVAENNTIAFGVDELLSCSDSYQMMDGFADTFNNVTNKMEYKHLHGEIDVENKVLTNSAFALWNFGSDKTVWQGEFGLRADQAMLWNHGNRYDSAINVDPRATISYTPIRFEGPFEKLTFSAGAGLFSAMAQHTVLLSDNMDFDKLDFKLDRTALGVVGTEAFLNDGWSIKLEGYYKYYLNRLYGVTDDRTDTFDIEGYNDGKGYAFGFDTMIQKRGGKHWDGYLTYSFVYSKFKDPKKADYKDQRGAYGEPLDTWYFPDFQRFHTLNLVLNYKPSEQWTLTLKGAFATGTPREDGDKMCYYSQNTDGTFRQRYARHSYYSDTLRTEFSCPIDIRISRKGSFKKNPKLKWEWYVGAEDIFVNLYSPETTKTFNQNTGKETPENDKADFSIGIPLINVGYRISF